MLHSASGDVLDNDWHSDGTTLTAILVSGPTHGTLDLNTDGNFTYTPVAGYVGDDSFTYRVADGTVASGYAGVSLYVTNAAPVAGAADYSVHAGNVLTGGVAARVSDSDDFDDVIFERATGTGFDPLHGTATVAADGSFTYSPTAGYVGEDGFYYRVRDGVSASPAYKVTVFVENAVAVGGEDEFFVWPGDGIAVGEANVLANDRDADGDAMQAVLVSGPMSATPDSFSLNLDGTFTYERSTPGTDTFTYAVSDGFSTGSPVTVTVRSATAPVGMDDYFFVPESGALTVALADGVLGNDAKAGGVALSAVLATGIDPAVGALTLNANGSFVFTPGANFVDGAEFTYVPFVNGAVQQAEAVRVKLVKAFGAWMDAITGGVGLEQVTFKTSHRDIVRDDGTNYEGANWVDKNTNGIVTDAGDQRTPVSYTRGNSVQLKNVQFVVSPAMGELWKDAQARQGKIRVRATQPGVGGITFGFGSAIGLPASYAEEKVDGVIVRRITLAQATSDHALANLVNYHENFQLDWELSFDNAKSWVSPTVRTSRTTMYVTYGQPHPELPLVETLLSISTRVESKVYSEQEFVTEVFKKFKPAVLDGTPKLYRTGGEVPNLADNLQPNLLRYYADWATTTGNWIDLIRDRDGTCVAWAGLLNATLAANGIASTRRIPEAKYDGERILVNNWSLGGSNLPGAGHNVAMQEYMRLPTVPVDPEFPDGERTPVYTVVDGAVVKAAAGDWTYTLPVKAKGVTDGQPNMADNGLKMVPYTRFNVPVANDHIIAPRNFLLNTLGRVDRSGASPGIWATSAGS